MGSLYWRDIPSWAVYFWMYEYLKRKSGVENGVSFKEETSRNLLYRMLAGGTAGVASWLVTYPVDVVKSLIMISEKDMTMK